MGGTIDKILGIGDQGGADVRDGSMHRGFSTTLRDNTKSTQEYLNIVYGTILVGGNQVFITSSGKNNKNLWIVMNISEGECNGIKQRDGVDQIFLDDKLYTELGSTFEYWFYSGTTTQTYDTNLQGVFADWDDNKRNTCYIVCKITYNGDLYQRVPKILIEMEGKKVYDFRDTTTKFSNNPVLVLYDFMTSNRYGCGLNATGPLTKIDEASWTAAANYCDTKGWTFNGAITKRKAQDIIDSILQLFRGNLSWYDGKYYLKYRDSNYESVVMNLNDYHVMQSNSGQMQIKVAAPSQFKTANGIRVKFKDPDQRYIEDDFIIGDSLGKIEELNLSLSCTDREHAAQIGVYNLERLRLNRQITGTFRDDAFQLDPGDLVYVTFESVSVQGTMRVDEMQVNTNGSVDLNLIFESPLLYDDDYNLIIKDVYECTLPDPNEVPPSVTNITVEEDTAHYRGRTFTRLIYDFDIPDGALWDHIEVWRSYDNIDYEHLFNVSNTFNLDNEVEGRTVYVKLRSVSLYNVKQTLASSPLVTWNVLGEEENPPPSPLYLTAVANPSAVNLYSDKLADPDIEVYEFRLGTTWSGGTFLGSLRSPNMNIPGIKPGTYTFWLNTKGTNGLYGTTPVSASISLPDPPQGWTLYDEFTHYYNLIDNAYFEEGVSPWTSDFGSLSTASGGVTGDCLRVTRASGLYQTAQNAIDPRPVEALSIGYSFWVKSGTSGDEAFEGGIWNGTTNNWIGTPKSGTSSTTWTEYKGTATMAGGDVGDLIEIRLVKDTSTAGYMQFDNVKVAAAAQWANTEHVIYSGDDYLKVSRGFSLRTTWYYLHDPVVGVAQTYAQRWKPFRDLEEDQLGYVKLWLLKFGSPTGNIKAYLYPKKSGVDEPDWSAGALATSDNVDVSTISDVTEGWTTFSFSSGCDALTEGTTYFIVARGGDFTGDENNTVLWGRDEAGRYGEGVCQVQSGSETGTWAQQTTSDLGFAADELVGQWTSRIIDVGAEDDYMTYAVADIVQVGGGNLWSDIGATTNTWEQINAQYQTWGELLQLDAAGQVSIKFYWGPTASLGYEAEKHEFLSVIAQDCEFYQLEITIIDPAYDIYMHVQEITEKINT